VFTQEHSVDSVSSPLEMPDCNCPRDISDL